MGSWNIAVAGRKHCCCCIWSRGLVTSLVQAYREDYHKLGLPESASLEEVKAAYFRKAKEHHPDSKSEGAPGEAAKFIELTEAYKRLTYESRNTANGLNNVDRSDPRNDPRQMEYWQIRRRQRTAEEIKFEEEMTRQNREKDRVMVRKLLLALAVGVFFGTIFPALFIGSTGGYVEGCSCDLCILKRINTNPSTKFLLRKRAMASNEDG